MLTTTSPAVKRRLGGRGRARSPGAGRREDLAAAGGGGDVDHDRRISKMTEVRRIGDGQLPPAIRLFCRCGRRPPAPESRGEESTKGRKAAGARPEPGAAGGRVQDATPGTERRGRGAGRTGLVVRRLDGAGLGLDRRGRRVRRLSATGRRPRGGYCPNSERRGAAGGYTWNGVLVPTPQ